MLPLHAVADASAVEAFLWPLLDLFKKIIWCF